ncbi:hypothetical protein ANTPLA_LOCUS6437 [Anthophora plagiata]
MEPLFQLHVEDIDILLPTMKERLMLHDEHAQRDPTNRDVVYQCLQGVLRFSHQHVESLMYHLCTLMSNHDTVSNVLRTGCVSSHFLEFVSTWLRYRRRYCNDEGPWNERSICKTPFEETLDSIKSYVNSAKDSKDETTSFNILRYAISASLVLSGSTSCCRVNDVNTTN